ncbi:AI-2E family transporter [Hymenobacter aerilatus]|uniref:AI-2E family transporter n=1 Tax=Hymenobacter aerilatus TaxID=2932251 RepID=A0A8T9T0D9_9BACT|nr:AI-2E family transporter [Hymenobacter aerilatus]UOR07101.1 AI-2E family transporter [Hymenobacter aerilatus]
MLDFIRNTFQAPPSAPRASSLAPDHTKGPFEPKQQSDSFMTRVLLVVGTVLCVGLLLWFLWASMSILLLGFGSVLFAVLLRAIGRLFCRISDKIPQKLAVTLALLLIIGLIAGFVLLAAPRISAQASTLSSDLPTAINKLESQLDQTQWGHYIIDKIRSDASAPNLSRMTGYVGSFLGIVANTVVLLIAGFFLALDPGLYVNGFTRLFPVARRQRAREVVGRVVAQLEGWLLGQFIAMLAVGILTWAGLMLLGIPLALVLGVLAFILDFVPFIGPIVAAVPGVLLAVLQGPEMMLYVGLIYLGVQQIESYVVVPLVQQRTVSVPPVLVLLGALLGGVLGGLPGTIIAMPALVTFMTLVQELYIKDALGDHSSTDESK